MGKTLLDTTLSSLVLLCLLFLPHLSFAQTPGLVYKIATNGGNKILDPDGNGYVSKTTAGFQLVNGIRLDEGADYSEIPYRPFPIFMDEPLADLKTGGSYGHTDYAPKVYDSNGKPVGSPLASFFDGTNFLFRVRLAGQSTASKGYSILIDSNNTLTGGSPNPGFEFEVVLATNFDVRVYDHRTNITGGEIIFSGSVDQYSQKAIAGSTGGGDADYFYDFFVPMSAFKGAITETTPLRMTGVTVTSAKSGIFGISSDIGGIDDNVVSGTVVDAWKSIINNTPLSTPTEIKDTGFTQITAAAPSVNSPLYTNSTEISGTSIEAAGSVITVYRNGVSIGTATVSSNGSWKLQSLSQTLLQAGDKIRATVKPTSESLSAFSSEVTVITGTCNTPAPQIVSREPGGKGFNFNTNVLGAQTIKIYKDGVLYQTDNSITATYTPYPIVYKCGTGNCFPSGSYTVSITPTGQCESPVSNSFCESTSGSPSTSPVVSTTSLTTTSTSISGTYNTAGTLKLFKNGAEISGKTATTTSTTFTWSINLSGITLAAGDRFWVVGTPATTSSCTIAEASNVLTVQQQSTSPTITGTYCGPTTTITGTSSEVAGTSIIVYVGTTQVGTTTVNSYGSWTATITSQSSGTITATATAPNKTVSASSAGVVIGTVYSSASLAITGTETSGTIYEGSTSVKGTAPAGAMVTLYINGAAYVDKDGTAITTIATGGNFLFSSISPFELYAGAILTVTARASSTSCESAKSAGVTVACNAASTAITATFTDAKFCPNTPVYIKLSTSEAGVIYNIYKNGVAFGSSVLGTGAAITLQSDPVTIDGTILQVKTIKVGAPCQYNIGGDMPVSLYPEVPKTFTVTASPESSSCANVNTTITVLAAQAGYSYQLINYDTKEKLGSLVIPSADGNLAFPAVLVSKTTTYGVIIKSTASGCVAENTILKTITISGGPDVNKAVTASQSTVCTNSTAAISVATQGSTYTYKIYQEGNATALATFSGNGTTIATPLSAPFTTTGIKNFYVTVSETNGCSNLVLSQKVSITATDGTGGTVSAGPNSTNCGSTYTLAGSIPTPGTGIWTVVSKPATAANPVFIDNTLYNTRVTGLVSGVYVFSWAVKSSCSGATTNSTVTITVNCAAEYSVRSNKLITDYVDGETLATVTDPDGIQGAQLVKGSLPAGTTLNTSTGTISVLNKDNLLAGNYDFIIRTTDVNGKTTDSPLSMRFYSSSLRPTDIRPLPVELVYFTATCKAYQIELQWMTASELNNERFEIERSTDGRSFVQIGTVSGNGTSNSSHRYTFIDTKPLAGIAYYRLKQVDFDKKAGYSKMIEVNNKLLASGKTLQAYPNPFSEKLTLILTAPATEQAILTVYNLQGRQLQNVSLTLEKGINNYEMATQQLANGIYILKITGTNTEATLKVMKK
ncbi:T9SS type A sorting domain-containing protein [Pontibacter sp. KCTC 32443]|uniref:T9SS type A sorting domain-containing protein n=1 Tax=Pontibacter TaxID=323449 RepID=UPI00164E0FD1|nr:MULTISPECIES: T9SS type A sorting domain-containing protein [Pontibacter]MBC5775061.1 T9SS type A sorting domain-containing protein [Pontibacter sp. KCTC 32443]